MINIYTDSISPRLSYIVEVIFEDLLNCSVHLSQDAKILDENKPCINYSNVVKEGIPYIRPHSLLFEQGIRKLTEDLNSEGLLFPSESDIAQQDIFAASFFLLTRYEEYSNKERDQYGRFEGKESAMHKAGLLSEPLIDQWAIKLHSQLRDRFDNLEDHDRTFQTLATFDIDVAYAFKGRGLWRRWRSTFNDFIHFNWSRLKERRRVLKKGEKDPFDTYDYQQSVCKQHNIKTRHFFLIGDYGPLDKNISHRQNILKDLIKKTKTWSTIGIHPSMASNESQNKVKKEMTRLKKLAGTEIQKSRQHYLYLDLPTTYQRLIKNGVTEDYSMGFADEIGFRAGTCSPYRWFDLEKNDASNLYIIPLAIMDSSLKDYLKLSPEEGLKVARNLKEKVRKVNGTFVMLWHNHSISDYGEWKGWQRVFEGLLKQ